MLAALAVVVLRDGGGGRPRRPAAAAAGAAGTLSPRILLYGDTLTARVDVTLDRRRVDPSSVAIRGAVPGVGARREAAGRAARLRRALAPADDLRAPLPQADVRARARHAPVRVQARAGDFTERTSRGRTIQRTTSVAWPRLIEHSRIAPNDLATVNPWRIDLMTLPEPSYRASPSLLLVLLVGRRRSARRRRRGARLRRLAAARARARAGARAGARRVVTPLERALELLETAAGPNGAADQRRSLELVAEVLAERGHDDEHARAARELAWSPTPPPVEATRGLAARVRATLEEELRRSRGPAGGGARAVGARSGRQGAR